MNNNDLAAKLRANVQELRRTPKPLADVIPLLIAAADALDRAPADVAADPVISDDEIFAAWDKALGGAHMTKSIRVAFGREIERIVRARLAALGATASVGGDALDAAEAKIAKVPKLTSDVVLDFADKARQITSISTGAKISFTPIQLGHFAGMIRNYLASKTVAAIAATPEAP